MARVLFIGNFEPAHSTENEVRSSFEALGWDVDRVQENRLLAAGLGFWHGPLRERADAADLVLYTRTWGLPEAEALLFWEWCRLAGRPTASLHLDLYYGLGSPKGELPRGEMPARDPMFRTAHVFTPDGDNDDLWARDGVNHCWLPPAIGSMSCWDAAPDPERWAGIDVAFVGSRGYHPEWAHRPRLIDELARRFGSRFCHIGGGVDFPGSDGHALRGDALQRMYATVPVIVGDSCWVNRQPPETRYWSDRVYEVWGRGGMLAMPYISALDEHLGGAYPCWEPWDDLDAMEGCVRDHLADEQGARAALVPEVRERHTYTNRIEEMLATMGIDA